MAASYNRVLLIGNLTRDPQLRYTNSGTAVAQLGVAVNRKFRNREDQWQEEVTFVDIECWGRTAENCNEYLSKGRSVFIEGRLKLDQWQDRQTGQNRQKLVVVADRVQFLGGGRGGGGGGGGGDPGGGGERRESKAPTQNEDPGTKPDAFDAGDDQVPF